MAKSGNQRQNTKQPAISSQEKDHEGSIDHIKFVYEQINSWIENADNKVSISCGIFTGVFGVVTFLTERYIKVPDNAVINECWRCIYKTSFIISLLAMAIAVFFYARAIIPNLRSNGKKDTHKKYPIFYGDIGSLSNDEYQKLMKNGTEEDFEKELILETRFNSEICMKKMERYRIGVIFSLGAIGLSFLSFLAHFMMYR